MQSRDNGLEQQRRLTPAEKRAFLVETQALAASFLDTLADRPVTARATLAEMRELLDHPLPESGDAPATILSELAAHAGRGTMANSGPRFFGFVIGGSMPAALGADWMTSAWDQNAGLFVLSPLVSVLEETAGAWLCDLFGLPAESSVGFVTGCQMANFTCLAAARHAVLRRVGWDVEAKGLRNAPPVRIVLGGEAHVTIYSALRMLGFGTDVVELAAADSQGRMQPQALKAVLERGQGPTIVCAQLGNINTGACDPVGEIAGIAHAHGAWLHVDGAFGLWAAATPAHRHLTDGVADADSWATDAHKWLNVPQDSGIAIVRDSAAHRAAMTSNASYLVKSAGAERDPVDWVPEFSRRARSIPVYVTLRALGRAGVAQLVEDSCSRARQMAELLGAGPGVEILNDVVLNQVVVRFHADGRDTSDLTNRVIARVQHDGTCWLGGSTWHGDTVMRVSFVNWNTSQSDVERSARAILDCLRAEVQSAS